MEDILQNLIKSYSENKSSDQPKQFKFYSNLSTTQSFKLQCELKQRIENGIQFLSERVLASGGNGLQSNPISSTITDSKSKIPNSFQNFLPQEFPQEIYTSILALDVLGDCEYDDSPSSMSMSNLPPSVIKNLIEFILPEAGVSTFGIFKGNRNNESNLSMPSTRPDSAATTSSSGCSSSEFAMDRDILNLSEGCDPDPEEESEAVQLFTANPNLLDGYPDDCNTTALALSVLLREGILDPKPIVSVMELLLSNVGDFSKDGIRPGVILTFLGDGESDPMQIIDPVSCANVLYLYYILTEDISGDQDEGHGNEKGISINFIENVESTQNFLLEALNALISHQDQNQDAGNVTHDDCDYGSVGSNNHLHPSPDALLYAMSRCTSISNEARNRFREPLISLLDKRVGSSSSSPLSLAMRILSADYLGLLGQDGIWIKRKLEGECCKLTELQDSSDGGWPKDVIFKIKINRGNDGSESHQVHFGGRELSTIFACRALQVFAESVKDAHKFLPNTAQKYYGY